MQCKSVRFSCPRIALFLALLAPLAADADRQELAARPRVKVIVGPQADSSNPDGNSESPLHRPFGVDFDARGNLYIVELEGGRVLRFDPAGDLRTIAGSGTMGYAGDDGPATSAVFNGMHNVAVTPAGVLFIADSWNHCVRRIDAATGTITTIAGTGEAGFSGDGGPASKARFDYVMCVTLSAGRETLHVADLRNRRVRAINLVKGTVRTIAGSGEKGVPDDGALAVESPLVDPRAVAADAKGNVYVLERGGHALRVVDPGGRIRTVVNVDGKPGDADGAARDARLHGPKHIALDELGRVYIADDQNGLIRFYDPREETVTTVLGRDDGVELKNPHGVCVEKDALYVVDTGHDRILRLEIP